MSVIQDSSRNVRCYGPIVSYKREEEGEEEQEAHLIMTIRLKEKCSRSSSQNHALIIIATGYSLLPEKHTLQTQGTHPNPISLTKTFEQSYQTFPPITFCNLNPKPFSSVREDPSLFQFVDAAAQMLDIDLSHFSEYEMPKYTYESSIDVNVSVGESIQELERSFQTLQTMFDLRVYESNDHILDIVNRSVLLCKFGNQPCDFELIDIEYRMTEIAACFAFRDTTVLSTLPGPSYGLNMYLNVHQEDYVPFFTHSAGMRVYIGSDDASFDLPPGFNIDIGLSKVIKKRLPGNDEKCSYTNTSILACMENCSYTLAACECDCRWKDIQCYGYDTRMCSTFTDLNCINDMLTESITDGKCSYCRPPCYEVSYKRSVSMSKWPPANSEPILREIFRHKNIKFSDASTDLISVRIYLSSLIIEQETEAVSYTVANFISDIGGQLGLWVGISCLSLLEVMELICLLIAKTAHRTRDRVRRVHLIDNATPTTGKHNSQDLDVWAVDEETTGKLGDRGTF